MVQHACLMLAAMWLLMCVPPALADDGNSAREVRLEQLAVDVPVIGRLGKPLGQMATVRGLWESPPLAKDGSLLFTITSVDQSQLEKPVQFYAVNVRATDRKQQRVEPKAGDEWTLRV